MPHPCCPLWGWCAAQRIKIVMIAGGNHTSVSCRVSGKGGIVGNFGLVPFTGRHPLSLALLDSSPTGEPRPLLPPPGSRGPCCPLWGKCRDSGKGGGVGNFEPLPFNEPHPLSQPLRAASSPTGEPRLPCCPRWGAKVKVIREIFPLLSGQSLCRHPQSSCLHPDC